MRSIHRKLSGGVVVLAAVLLSAACGGDATVQAGTSPGSVGVATLRAEPPSSTPPQEEGISVAVRAAYRAADKLAQANADKLGPPFIEDGQLVVTATDEEGLDIARAAVREGEIPGATPRYKIVARSSSDITRIREEILKLTGDEVPGARHFTAVSGDPQNNRLIIDTTSYTPATLKALGERFGADAIAVRLDPVEKPSI